MSRMQSGVLVMLLLAMIVATAGLMRGGNRAA